MAKTLKGNKIALQPAYEEPRMQPSCEEPRMQPAYEEPLACDDQGGHDQYDQGTLDQAISMVQLLAEKMSERLAFERINTKLYEGLIAKCLEVGELECGPSIAELRLLRQDKVRNFLILKETIEEFGGDPMELTASAECAMLAMSGLPKVVNDIQTSIPQALDAVLISELAEREGWDILVGICKRLGRPDLAERCETALSRQNLHVQKMRDWVFAALISH